MAIHSHRRFDCTLVPPTARGAALILACAVALAAGCTTHDSQSRPAMFSPDGAYLAQVQTSEAVGKAMPGLWDEWTMSQKASVTWHPAGQGGAKRSAAVGARAPEQVHLAYSPDSRLLAAVAPEGLTIISLADGRTWRLSRGGERVTSFVWLSPVEVAYAAHTNFRGPDKTVSDRMFYRQDAIGRSERRSLYLDAEARVDAASPRCPWPLEHWSPDGRYVVFASPGGPLRLLDTAGGSARSLGEGGQYHPCHAAWKPDGSAVMCLAGALERARCQVLLVEPTGDVRDLSEDFAGVLGGRVPPVAPQWTPDGEFLTVNDPGRGAYLVSPHPWRVIPLHERLSDRPQFASSRDWIATSVAPLPVSGWVLVRSPAGAEFACDYEAKQLVPLSPRPTASCCSPDGQTIVAIERDSGTVHTIPLAATPN